MKSKTFFQVILAIFTVALLSSCTMPDPNPSVDSIGPDGHIAGFWSGIWHGMICPLMFIVSLFSDNVNIYEVHNSGGWYNFGFLIGLSCSIGGSGASSSRKG